MKEREPSFLRAVVVVAIMFSSIIPVVLFLVKWVDSSFDEAWDAFDEFVEKCLS